jgi:DNA-directed RNA polymerase specialized sigma24 family protein
MDERLTGRERACIELHYFRGLTFEAIAQLTHTNRSSCCRAAQRGVRRLRAAAAEQGLRPVLPARLGGRGG